MQLIYLASPYTAETVSLRRLNYDCARLAAKMLLMTGLHIYSPVVHGHAIETVRRIRQPVPYSHWIATGLDMLSRSDSLWVLTLRDWSKSRGVNMEIEHAKRRSLFTSYVSMEDIRQIYETSRVGGARRIDLRSGTGTTEG